MTGKFIVLEGIDGSGTTTQAKLLVSYLFEKDKQNVVVLTREPTKLSIYGQELRRRLSGQLGEGEKEIHDPQYWTNLFISDREWHLNHVVEFALYTGLQVISDRYKLSTISYQSAQGVDMDELIRRHEKLYVPDLTLILDCPAEVVAERLQKDRGAAEYFEKLDFQKKVQANYLLAADKLKDKEKIVVLDGTQSLDDVTKEIQREVDQLYGYK